MKKLKQSTKDLVGVGITGMAGLGAMGAMSSLPGMPKQAKTLTPIVGAGVQIGGLGAMLQVTKNIFPEEKQKKKTKRKK